MKYGRRKEFVDAEIEARMGISNLSAITATTDKANTPLPQAVEQALPKKAGDTTVHPSGITTPDLSTKALEEVKTTPSPAQTATLSVRPAEEEPKTEKTPKVPTPQEEDRMER